MPAASPADETLVRRCAMCNVEYWPQRRTSGYCSTNCRVRACHRRHRRPGPRRRRPPLERNVARCCQGCAESYMAKSTQSRYCSRRCADRTRHSPTRCISCHKPMWRAQPTRSGQHCCHPCRRLRAQPTGPTVTACAACGVSFTRTRANRAYCSDDCRATRTNRFHTRVRGTTTERGYGAQHRLDRKLAATLHDPTHLCARCGEPLGPMGPQLHYDHNGDRTGYLGFSHARCNLRAGAREGNRRRLGFTEPPRRDWYA